MKQIFVTLRFEYFGFLFCLFLIKINKNDSCRNDTINLNPCFDEDIMKSTTEASMKLAIKFLLEI